MGNTHRGTIPVGNTHRGTIPVGNTHRVTIPVGNTHRGTIPVGRGGALHRAQHVAPPGQCRGQDKRPLCQLSSKRLEDHLRPTGSRAPDSRCFVEDTRSLCQLSSKRLEDHLRPTGSRTPDSRYFVEDKRPLCQLSSKRLEDNWQSGLLSYTDKNRRTIPVGSTHKEGRYRWGVAVGALHRAQHVAPPGPQNIDQQVTHTH